MKELNKAIVNVMKAVKGIDKDMTVGTGNNSYKGVSDQRVKQAIGKAMEENRLCIIPISVEPDLQIEKWIEKGQYGDKAKMQVFIAVKTRYMLLHESGESIEICGYGHGVDSQDKAAGKATTYALKYALLYTFMVPTGKIDDADNQHSDDVPAGKQAAAKQPVKQPAKQPAAQVEIVPLVKGSEQWTKAVEWLQVKPANTVDALLKRYSISEADKKELQELKSAKVTA
jgi:hypothetical protein